MFPNQSMRAYHPQQLAMMAQMQAMPQAKEFAAMNAYLQNLQKINQANLLSQKYEKEFNNMKTQQVSAEVPVKTYAISNKELSLQDTIQSLNMKRNLVDIKLEQANEEMIQKKIKTSMNTAHTTSTKASVTPVRDAKINAKFPTNMLKYKKLPKKSTGSYEEGDQVLKVLAFKFNKDQKLQYLVEWKPRNDGTKPQVTYIDREILLQKDASVVALYYENQIFNARNSFAFQ